MKNLSAPSISHISLVKSLTKVHIDINKFIVSRLISLFMIGFNALRMYDNDTCELTFENSVDEGFLEEFIHQSDENPGSHKSTFFRQSGKHIDGTEKG